MLHRCDLCCCRPATVYKRRDWCGEQSARERAAPPPLFSSVLCAWLDGPSLVAGGAAGARLWRCVAGLVRVYAGSRLEGLRLGPARGLAARVLAARGSRARSSGRGLAAWGLAAWGLAGSRARLAARGLADVLMF